ncbi:MAG: glycosyltransferase family 4 protein [Acidimicrobiales bacterium]
MRMRVLHLHFRWGAGSAAAVSDYIRATPAFEHHLVYAVAPGCQLDDQVQEQAASVRELPSGLARQIVAVRRAVAAVEPDVVHAHSSLAGACARTALGRRWPSRVVYTPHCYAFERTDVGPVVRSAFWLAEAALSLRGGQVAACAPYEADLARSLPGRQQVVYVPNIAGPDAMRSSGMGSSGMGSKVGRRREGEPMVVIAVGRLAPQKAPEMFAHAARIRRDAGDRSRWVWVGGGEADLERQVRSAGVEVTGWLPRRQALEELAASDVYVHAAAWDGAPITVLEAAAAGVPILARRTSAMASLGVEPLFDTAEELADLVGRLCDGTVAAVAERSGRRLREAHTPAAQREALHHVYGLAASKARGKAQRPAPRSGGRSGPAVRTPPEP